MKHAKELYGPTFDWERGVDAMNHVADDDGNINWHAAFNADPGVVKCQGCGEYIWAEANKMLCECGTFCGRGVTP